MDSVISRYMAAMLAGLAGNPNLIHCTVLAVSRVYFQFRDLFPDHLTEQVTLLSSPPPTLLLPLLSNFSFLSPLKLLLPLKLFFSNFSSQTSLL